MAPVIGNVELRPASSGSIEFDTGHDWEVPSGYVLRFARSGNLEVRNPLGRVVWESGTGGRGARKLALQTDGNLVIYEDGGRAIWSTNTQGNDGAFLSVQSDGNVVLYAPDRRPIWTTGTARK
jgi:hypothetical protein